MNTIIPRPGSPLSQASVISFTTKTGIELPPVYHAFLLQHNGCFLEKKDFKRTLNDGDELEYIMEEFFSLEEIDRGWEHIKPIAEEVGALQIGSTVGSPIVCLGIMPDNRDCVFIYDGDFGLTVQAHDINEFIERQLY